MNEERKQCGHAVITKRKSSPFVLGVTFQTFFANTGKKILIDLFIFAGDLSTCALCWFNIMPKLPVRKH